MRGGEPLSWAALLEGVQAQHPELFRSWFLDLPDPTWEAGELRIECPDPARASYLRDHCTQAFVGVAMANTGRLVPVRVICPVEPVAITANETQWRGLTSIPLNPDYTFEHFVVGTSNRLAHAALKAVCSQPGSLYNPVFVHGPSGLGKTHLLQATCAELVATNPQINVLYLSSETFINDFIRAIETGQLPQFRDRARCADVLALDDIQFLANRESSQEELFHTFNTLFQGRKQIILSADSPPSEIPTLEDRLVSRFNWGLVTEIGVPNRETRHAILQKKARLRGCEIPDEVLDVIAERVRSNIRLLEGALTKLITETQIGGKPMTLETARTILDSFDSTPTKPPQIGDIIRIVGEHFGVRTSELLGRKRSRSISYPRQIGMYLARKLTPLSLEEIGGHFGGRDHSTVLHAERVIEAERGRVTDTAEILANLTRELLGHK